MLGLDRLAKEKRAAQAFENGTEANRKRARAEGDDEPTFKGEITLLIVNVYIC
jgi:hypothetical protein